LINTHSHIDHSGGLRGFVAEGSTILTHSADRSRALSSRQSRRLDGGTDAMGGSELVDAVTEIY
jgi:glyoxylase-like metal-dependent hydrolase (beta-lactamase superfamily II)